MVADAHSWAFVFFPDHNLNMMLRSLPVKHPQELVKLGVKDWNGITDSFASTELYSYPFYRQLQQKNAVFSDTAAIFSMGH